MDLGRQKCQDRYIRKKSMSVKVLVKGDRVTILNGGELDFNKSETLTASYPHAPPPTETRRTLVDSERYKEYDGARGVENGATIRDEFKIFSAMAIFQRYLRPKKDYLSFSLLYDNGKSHLICLKAIISSGQGGRCKIDGWSDGGLYLDDGRDLTSNRASDSSVSTSRDVSSPNISVSFNPDISPNSLRPENSFQSESAPSTSSHDSAPDDYDALGDVYIWCEVICDSVATVVADKNTNYLSTRGDVLLPRPLESNVVLDVYHVACGVKHAALVTSVGLVACGEFHTCAIIMTGEIYTWGDGTHNVGLLGHDYDVSHWIPKRISVFLRGLQVALRKCSISKRSLSGLRTIVVACGVWHTAAIVEGKGANGRLGHGDVEDRKTTTLVEGLKNGIVNYIACGSHYSAAICLHKWVSGAEETQCSACKQAFGFTRKRHNCYNCGLVHCHSCSSRKAISAAVAPNPGKPYRVYDSCFAQMNKGLEAGNNRRNSAPRLSGKNVVDVAVAVVGAFTMRPPRIRAAKSTKKSQEAMALAAEESAKSKAAKEVINSLTAKLKKMAERLSPEVCDTENIKSAYLPNGLEKNGVNYPDANELGHLRSDSIGHLFLASPLHLILPQSMVIQMPDC
ncbi:Regulator of chromosome condensation (RCC1) family with FYVE zinc finger domain isoform 3 [Hibiscus syriacus]|uniref:Regulator of chromosome condensation (RCC1) family with FYVE zinc finger domain isoform 3 n=1 Tax=Hibiscus syriacus TaxID=106335 RepID=A0A6A3AG58_HIBSY|nr:Regulator of chromosome condensation (RCC1) family with FYVE zinc finger domain isoform 3 [Hibiscus syriacus]